jgi:3-hydroxyisobutyrate dehydrogenase-like beta-hydroxyacid dehydrogenase
MARALLRAGFPVTAYNRTASRALALGDVGAAVADTPAEVARAADVVITMLSDEVAVYDVFERRDGLFAGAQAGEVLIEMSTIGPDAARELAKRATSRRVAILDAPVSGSVAAAETATLVTVVGGDRDTFDVVRPVLAAMTNAQLWMGPSGAGAAMKLALNSMIATTNEALAESLVISERSGIPREAAYEAIAASAVGSRFVEYKRAAFLDPAAEPVAFTLSLMQKDLGLYLALARQLGVPVPGSAAADQMLTMARSSEGEDADFAMVAATLRGIAGASGGVRR